MLLAAIAGFAQFQAAFDRIWNVPPPESKGLVAGMRRIFIERWIAFLILLSLGVLVIVVFLTGIVISHVQAFAHGILPAADALWGTAPAFATLLLNTLILTLTYRWLPKVPVSWTDALRGGAMAAGGWEMGRQILGAYLIGTRYSSAYGVIGSFIAILLWCYYAVVIIFLGAEYIQQLQRTSSNRCDSGQTASDQEAFEPRPCHNR